MLGQNTNLKACSNIQSATTVQEHYMEMVYNREKQKWLSACPVPCQQIKFAAQPTYFHRTSILNMREDDFRSLVILTVSYETLGIEEHVESLVYDIGNFLAAVGGNLGLFVGFSCLSMFLSLFEFLHPLTKML